jgi:hypothetical protein
MCNPRLVKVVIQISKHLVHAQHVALKNATTSPIPNLESSYRSVSMMKEKCLLLILLLYYSPKTHVPK